MGVSAGSVAPLGRARGARHADLDSAAGHRRRWATCSSTPITRPATSTTTRPRSAPPARSSGRSIRRAAGTTWPTSPAIGRCASGTTRSGATRGASRSSSTTGATPRSTTRARPKRPELLLRLYLEKRDPRYKPALDKAIQFVLDSQYPDGFWPQRFPLQHEFSHHGLPDYTSLSDLQRRRRRREHRLSRAVLSGARRPASARRRSGAA